MFSPFHWAFLSISHFIYCQLPHNVNGSTPWSLSPGHLFLSFDLTPFGLVALSWSTLSTTCAGPWISIMLLTTLSWSTFQSIAFWNILLESLTLRALHHLSPCHMGGFLKLYSSLDVYLLYLLCFLISNTVYITFHYVWMYWIYLYN